MGIIIIHNPWIKIVLIGYCGACVGLLTGFPIGIMLGTLICVATVQIKYKLVSNLPIKVRRALQVLIGGSLGLSFSEETLYALTKVWLIAILMPLFHIILALIMSLIIYRILKIDLVTILCSMAPAGIGEMIILSEKYKASMPIVSTMHVYRVLVIITVIPPLILFGL